MRDLSMVCALVAIALGGCAAGSDSGHSSMVRDSAGVRIIGNMSDPGRALAWRLDPVPLLELGVEDGEGPEVFGSIGQVLRLRSGEIVVADGLTREIRVFSAAGVHLRTVGRRGEGPGEFVNLTRVAEVPGDSLDVVDGLGGRISVFTTTGDFVRTFPLPRIPRGMAPNVVGWLGDGTLVVSTLAREPVDGGRNVVVYLVDREGRVAGEVGEYPYSRLGRNGLGVAFGGLAEVAVVDSLIWFGHSSRFELHALDRTGEVRRIVRLVRTPMAITRAEIDAMQEAVRGDLERGGANPNLIQRILDTDYAATYPLHGRILADHSGNLWVERFRNHLLPDDSPRAWDLFDAEGRLRELVWLPEGFQLAQVGEDYLLGVQTDSLGVQRVRLYTRGPGSNLVPLALIPLPPRGPGGAAVPPYRRCG